MEQAIDSLMTKQKEIKAKLHLYR